MVEVNVTAIIPARIERIWSVIRDFNAMPLWHPLIKDSRIEGGAPSDQVGCIRNFQLKDGNTIREKLLGLSDIGHRFSYEILESKMPITDYVASLQLQATPGVNHTFGHWKARFKCEENVEKEMKAMISNDVFQAGFDALIKRFD